MDDDTIEECMGSTYSTLDTIVDKEFDEATIKFASFLSIVYDKKLTNIAIFSCILKDKFEKNAFKLLTQIDNDRVLVLQYLRKYPSFCKSKVVRRLIEEYVK